MPDIKAALTRKLGPLPVWAWGGVAAGGIWLWRSFNKGATTESMYGGGLSDGAGGGIFTPAPGALPGAIANEGSFGAPATLSGRVSIGTAAGGYGEVEGPFDFIERILPKFGGILQPPPAPKVSSPAPVQPKPSVPLPKPPAPKPAPAPAPKPAPVRIYTVKSGDTLSRIAAAYGTTWQKIYAVPSNKAVIGSNPNLIRAGQRLTIP